MNFLYDKLEIKNSKQHKINYDRARLVNVGKRARKTKQQNIFYTKTLFRLTFWKITF